MTMLKFIGGLTEDQIENCVSSKINNLDAAFMAHRFGPTEYDIRIKEIYAWSECEYRFSRKSVGA